MIILGVDPGLLRTGYAIISQGERGVPTLTEAGLIKPPPKDSLDKRLIVIYDELTAVIDEFKPEVLAVEELYSHYAHPRTAILMGHVRGVVCLLASKNGLVFFGYPATLVKKMITGDGSASKDRVKMGVFKELGISNMKVASDVTDALAIALTHYFISRKK
jgi:crossover junction endodeoxyribonuclease RuvC